MRRSGRPLTKRKRMDMLLCNVTRVGVLTLRRWRPVRRCGRVRVSAHILATHDMHRRNYWPPTRTSSSSGTRCNSRSVPHTTWADIVEPVAAAATAPAAFAEATGFVALLQNLMQRQKRSKVGTSNYYQGCVGRLTALSSMVNRTQSAHSRSVRVWDLSQSLEARARHSTRPGHLWSWCSGRRQCWVHNEHE